MLGDRIRQARKEQNYTLHQLAAASGLTASYISQVERNLAEPSLSALRNIAAVLHTPITHLLEEDVPPIQVIRANQRRSITLPGSHVFYECLSSTAEAAGDRRSLEVVLFHLEPHSWNRDDHIVHPTAEECITVLSGTALVDCGDSSYRLETGDSLYLRNNQPCKVYNPGDSVAEILACLTPPVY